MDKLDRLGWAAGFAFSCYGVQIGVRTNREDVLARLRAQLPPNAAVSESREVDLLYSLRVAERAARTGTRTYHLLYQDFVQVARTEDFEEIVHRFTADVELSIAQVAPGRVFVHAGVVGWKGRAILLPGCSFSGKSTLVASLVKAGALYYSDYFALLDHRGTVHAYPRPLSIRREDRPIGDPVPVEAIGGRSGKRPIPVGAVYALSYKEGVAWRRRNITHGKGILELLLNTVPARRRAAESLATLKNATANARFVKGFRGEADEIAGKILNQMGP